MRRTTTILIVAISTLLTLAAHAQTVSPVGGVVNVYGAGYAPAVVTLPSGDFVVAWSGGSTPPQASKVTGGSPGTIFSVGTSGRQAPDVAVDNAGNFVVTWRGYYTGVLAQRFDSSASPVGGMLSVGGFSIAYTKPRVSKNKANGNFVVAWQQFGSVYVQPFLSSGYTAAASFSIGSYGYKYSPDVAMDTSGNFMVTWSESGSPYAQAFNFSGSSLGSSFTLAPYGDSTAVTSTSSGQFVVTWSQGYGSPAKTEPTGVVPIGGSAVFMRRATAGGPVGSEIPVNTTFTGCAENPEIDANGSYFVVTWEGYAGSCSFGKRFSTGIMPNIDGDATGIGAQVYTAGGAPVGGNFIANAGATASYENDPSVSINASDEFTIAWEGSINAQQFLIGQPPVPVCPTAVPVDLIAPADLFEVEAGTPVLFEWVPAPGAIKYELWLGNDGAPPSFAGATVVPSLLKNVVPEGVNEWYVVSIFGATCPTEQSVSRTLTVLPSGPVEPPPGCGLELQPLASVVGEATTGQSYRLEWEAIDGASKYHVQESLTEDFIGGITQEITTDQLKVGFTHPGLTVPTPYFYRVAGVAACDETDMTFGPYSKIVRVVGLPQPEPSSTSPQVVSQFGNEDFVETFLFVPGFSTSKTTAEATYLAESNEPWLTVSPASGALPPEGTTVSLIIDPTMIDLGANTATVTVTRDDGLGKSTSGSSSYPVPAAISMVTPVTPIGKAAGPPENALIIPAVANVPGFESKWFSDVRITNRAGQIINYELNFSATDRDGVVDGKRTKISIRPGQTVALDDIVRQWYGFGDLADGTNGALEVRPLNFQGKVGGTEAAPMLATVASSRTYTRNENSLASYGQFIPAVPFSSFIKSGVTNSLLMMQQVSQNADLRTNFGLVEGAGKSANVMMTAYDREGTKLGEFPFALKPGEHKQLNSLLALNSIAVQDGRMEVQVVSGEGAVTSYASVVAKGTGDPSLVPGVNPSLIAAKKFVMAGVADLRAGDQSWRSDVRIFNPNPTTQMVNIFFYPQGETTPLGPVEVEINSGEIAVLEGVVDSLFNRQDLGGALHIVPANGQDTSLVVTGETYDVSELGKYGQFISGVTEEQAIGLGSPGLEVMQVEDSAQFRTNLGIAEVTGQGATVQVQLTVPNSLIAPTRFVALEGNEFTQLNGVVREMAGGRDVYNGRLTVRVTAGNGKITTYGSTVDIQTKDATFSPGQ